MSSPTPLTTAEVANKLGTDPRTLRRFLRSGASGRPKVGKGKHYEFSSNQMPTLRKRFDAWRTETPPAAP